MVPALSLRHLSKTYRNGVIALNDIDLDIAQGDFFALLGPNGAGKTTTLGIVTSLVTKSAGQVSIFGIDIDQDFARARRHIGLVPQEFNFNIFEPVVEIVIHQAGYYGIPRRLAAERAERALSQLGLWDKRNEQARTLSGGMKRRLMIARALAHEPRLLILDEPTAGVDIEIRHSMWQFLRELNAQGTTIILTTHYLEEAEHLCRTVAIIDQGRVVENTTVRELIAQLNIETMVLELATPLVTLPVLEHHTVRQLDAHTLEIDVDRRESFNSLFDALTRQRVMVAGMRNKSNRLERLFIERLAQGEEGAGQ